MVKFGELKDEKACDKICDGLKLDNIHAWSKYNHLTEKYELFVSNENDLKAATLRLRILLGLAPPPPKISPEWAAISLLPKGAYATSMIILCVMIAILSYFDKSKNFTQYLFFSAANETYLFSEILNGQLWRIITPIFLHFGFIHLLFNMMWLKDLGKIVEFFFGEKKFLYFVLIVGAFSNLGQYLTRGPKFGGMSGVVYGLLGLIWVSKKVNAAPMLSLPKNDMYLMVGWFFLCMTGVFGPIANTAHGVGLGMGMILGTMLSPKTHLLKNVIEGNHNFFKTKLKFIVLAFFFMSFSMVVDLYFL